jgi:hypothetical protein
MHDSVLTFFVVLVALVFVVQGGILYAMLRALQNLHTELGRIHADIREDFEPLTRSVTELVTGARQPIEAIATNFAEISRLLRERAVAADSVLEDLLDRTRMQIIRADQLVTGLIERVDSTAETVQRNVLAPLREVSAVVAGTRRALEFLFSRRPHSNVHEATQDEELFI